MKRHRFLISVRLIFVAALALSFGISQSYAQSTAQKNKKLTFRSGKPTTAEKKAAAMRAAALGLKPGVAGLAAAAPLAGPAAAAPAGPEAAAPILPGIEGPGGIPHYFGPYGNWAYSPLPIGNLNTALTVDSGGSGYTGTVTVTITDAYDSTKLNTANATVVAGAITAITLAGTGTGYSAPVVTITNATGEGASATATLNTATLTGGLPKFIDPLPGLWNPRSGPAPARSIPLGVPDVVTYPGSDYYEIALREFSQQFHSSLPASKLRGYVQVNNGTNTYSATNTSGCGAPPAPHICGPADNTVVPAAIRYLGPIIVAKGTAHNLVDPPTPVRIKFINNLPTGANGNLFLPVDETIPGAGPGPSISGVPSTNYTQNRATIHLHGNNTVWLSDGNTHQWITPAGENTPYPAGVSARNVPDMDGANCASDLNEPLLPGTSGCMTFYYTNAQSARLQFYHDHALGITRLNVIAGEAAGYVLTDAVEQDMINGTNTTGVNPGTLHVLPDIGIPLVIQDRTFVDETTIFAQDPTWNWGTGARNGSTGNITAAVRGDLWYPHVYMSAENPTDVSGTNSFGRWMYGPWFNPPVPECVDGQPVGCIEVGPVPNPYHQAACDQDPPGAGCNAPWEPELMPGVPNPSIAGEAFLDTPIVNGAAYPYVVLEPKAYRFRILNASNDRFLNLQLYVAADKATPTTAGSYVPASTPPGNLCATAGTPAFANCTEVDMVPVSVNPVNQYGDTPSGIPDPTTAGPAWWQIGTEGGFLPAPVEVPQLPVGWNLDATAFNFGVVNQHSLLLGSAERADVVVDFSAFAGKTLILYNDAPAAFPAGVATYDYYTGVANQMDAGGAPTTQPGYGPNTRTIMQIRVLGTTGTPTPQVTLANLNTVFAKTALKRGVFEASQDAIIVPQAAYNSAYNTTFPSNANQFGQIADTSKTFRPIDPATGLLSATSVTLPFEMKAMHDEMGGVYDTMFGRMSGILGVSLQQSPNHVLVPYTYASPPTDLVKGSAPATPVAVLPDGTQIWRIFHNGVDTHTIHTHLFTAQILNRVSQDGVSMMPPDPEERGWKDTFRINPLEVTYLALRPTVPTQAEVPFEVPNSIRLIDPTLPEGATLTPPAPAGWFDPAGNGIDEILNHYVNFGWEYVWHCHILAHEEMDMMHAIVFAVPPMAPTGLSAQPRTGPLRTELSWVDNSQTDSYFTIERATNSTFTQGLTTLPTYTNSQPTGTVIYFDPPTGALPAGTYFYRVTANNVVGDEFTAGFPTMSANTAATTTGGALFVQVTVGTPPNAPSAPTNFNAALRLPSDTVAAPQMRLLWRDNATNETGFVIERCTGTGCSSFAALASVGPRAGTGQVTYDDLTVRANTIYRFRVKAVNNGGSSAYATLPTPADRQVPQIPSAPVGFTAIATPRTGGGYTMSLAWSLTANPTNFTIERAENASFTTNLVRSTVVGTARTSQQTVLRNRVYYYRIRANNTGGSTAWVRSSPNPVITGN